MNETKMVKTIRKFPKIWIGSDLCGSHMVRVFISFSFINCSHFSKNMRQLFLLFHISYCLMLKTVLINIKTYKPTSPVPNSTSSMRFCPSYQINLVLVQLSISYDSLCLVITAINSHKQVMNWLSMSYKLGCLQNYSKCNISD